MSKNRLIGLRIPININAKVERIARTSGISKSEIIRDALNQYIEKKES